MGRGRSSSSSRSRTPPRRKPEKVEKVGVYKEIQEEEDRRKACGEPPLGLAEKDAMFRNYTRKQQGLPPLTVRDMLGDKGGGGKGKGKDKGKDK
eukprot:CAMPEP_0197871270 /NCGR_PEP_ID=MMETSP1439-20131203/1747_1 /TAXON_ID=66791 /ORGANISM="Gonyaulax spinifera, Strain CCMP409" /LENGTH=93 /DNA_ID=CAMNT_0043490201 /DNA_START=84 /DNA_END=362 /DNA_ORIENTATION=+